MIGGEIGVPPASFRLACSVLRMDKGGLNKPLPDVDVVREVDVDLPWCALKPGAMGETDFRFRSTRRLEVLGSESQSDRPDLRGLWKASEGDNDDTEDWEPL
jgi:hypothetical protein